MAKFYKKRFPWIQDKNKNPKQEYIKIWTIILDTVAKILNKTIIQNKYLNKEQMGRDIEDTIIQFLSSRWNNMRYSQNVYDELEYDLVHTFLIPLKIQYRGFDKGEFNEEQLVTKGLPKLRQMLDILGFKN